MTVVEGGRGDPAALYAFRHPAAAAGWLDSAGPFCIPVDRVLRGSADTA
ncbi:hypothetical protein ACWDV4_22160 [Micromonospora sp. NPDC003197]